MEISFSSFTFWGLSFKLVLVIVQQMADNTYTYVT